MARDPQDSAHETWLNSDRVLPTRFVRPVLQFTGVEAAGGIVLLIGAIAALVWANAPFGESYTTFWNTHLTLEIGDLIHLDESLKDFVNDALMTVFFFVVGLEIKRELVVGELRDRKRAALPAIAAIGGMVLPALLYFLFVAGEPGEAGQGWGIPMATDIAFSVGVISLLGTRVSVSARLFLLALAIADDIGAIAVIAIFYTTDLAAGWLAAAIVMLVLIKAASRVGIRSMIFYVGAGILTWFFVFESGVHATLAGVALGFLTPATAWYSDEEYFNRADWILAQRKMDEAAPLSIERIDEHALSLSNVSRESVAPLNRLQHALHPWSSFVIVPIFALANAGVRFSEIDVGAAVTSPVSMGVAFGLVVGKIVGISGATWLALRFNIGKLPRRTGWSQVVGLAALAGIGFTVSLFITELAFTDALLTDQAKIGIFLGSTVAGVLGYTLLRRSPTPEESLAASREEMGLTPLPDGEQPESDPEAASDLD
jgi:NhaA family Na+:H+ antiporter